MRIWRTVMGLGLIACLTLSIYGWQVSQEESTFPVMASPMQVVAGEASEPFMFDGLLFTYDGIEVLELSNSSGPIDWPLFEEWRSVEVYTFNACTRDGTACTRYLIQVCDNGREPFRDGEYSLGGFFVEERGVEGKVPFTGCSFGNSLQDPLAA